MCLRLIMDHHQHPQHGYHNHPCYNQDNNPGHNQSMHGHNQDTFHQQYNAQGSFDTYSTQLHPNQFSPEYQGML